MTERRITSLRGAFTIEADFKYWIPAFAGMTENRQLTTLPRVKKCIYLVIPAKAGIQ